MQNSTPPNIINPQANTTSRYLIKSIKAKADAKRTVTEKMADFITGFFGSIPFMLIHILWFGVWIALNTNMISGFQAFDPYPFGLLTMIVSLEAIFLSIFVLMSQNRTSTVDDLREEVDLQVDIITEKEITKLMSMVAKLMEKSGIEVANDQELNDMLKPTNLEKIEKALSKQVSTNI